jgi:hypothetical protein
MSEPLQPSPSFLAASALAALLAAGGCDMAKETLRADFADYNAILQANQSEQLLLNLVRIHYRESPMFLQAGTLTASYENSFSGGPQATLQQGDQSLVGVSGSYTFSAKPTISYSPIEGKDYVQQFMTEISPQTFGMLVRARWPIGKLAGLLVERVVLPDGTQLLGMHDSPTRDAFLAFFRDLEANEERGQLLVVFRKDGGVDLKTPERTIGVESFQLRSLFSAMFVAAHDVETPASQAAWTKPGPKSGALSVRATEKPPADALVCVQYAGWHYSVARDDIATKDMLALLLELHRIQAGPPAAAPLLTIPAR